MTAVTRRALLAGITISSASIALGAPSLCAAQPGTATPAPPPTVVPPPSPIEDIFTTWVDAFNFHDADRLRTFHLEYSPAEEVESNVARDILYGMTWGEIVVHETQASAPSIRALIETTITEEWLMLIAEFDGETLSAGLQPGTPPASVLPAAPVDDSALVAEMTRYVEKLAAADVFSGTILIAREGKPIFTHAAGMANIDEQIANDLTTRFNLGSMNKMFTATLIAQLEEAGKLTYDDPVGTHLPDLPETIASTVTVHHLLTHTSGLGDFFGPEYDASKDSLLTNADYLPLFIDKPLEFTPGQEHRYSNGGFILLGLVIEALTGQTWDEAFAARIATPAGMTHTGNIDRDTAGLNVAVGYTLPIPNDRAELTVELVEAGRVPNTFFLAPSGTSAGGGYSTVEDFLRFDRALRTGTILGASSLDTMTEGKVATPGGSDRKYAYGFEDDRSTTYRFVGHGGGAPGINARFVMFRDIDATLVVLANYDEVARTLSEKALALMSPARS